MQYGAATNPAAVYGPSKEWNVLIVNDNKTVNAMAVPGALFVIRKFFPVSFWLYRYYCRLHRYPSRLSG